MAYAIKTNGGAILLLSINICFYSFVFFTYTVISADDYPTVIAGTGV